MTGWWQQTDDDPVFLRSFDVDDVHFVQPVGFVWFSKPRYRVKARTRRTEA